MPLKCPVWLGTGQIYDIEEYLGEGGFATVRTGRHKVGQPCTPVETDGPIRHSE